MPAMIVPANAARPGARRGRAGYQVIALLTVIPALTWAAPAGSRAVVARPAVIVVATAYTYWPGDDDVLGGAAPGETGPLLVPHGADVLFVNAETLAPDPHTFTSIGCVGSGGEACWFDSGTVAPQRPGDAAIVATGGLAPGRYRFMCTIHPDMRGELRVIGPDGSGPPPP